MSENSFSPKSRQEDERIINREQKDFSAGMFDDVPKTSIPDNGVAYLKNFTNYGDRLVGRAGSKEWGKYSTQTRCADLPSFATGISSTSTVSDSYRTITIVSGYAFDDTNVGDYFVHDDGSHERIYSVTSESEIVTRANDSEDKDSTAAWLRGQINGLYFHKYKKKIVLHIRDKIYIARDTYISSWDLAHCRSYEEPENDLSSFDEINNDVILFNANGVYRIELENHPADNVFYYKINSTIPDNLTGNSYINDEDTYPYRYRYLSSLSVIDGEGDDRHRADGLSILRLDSGSSNAVYGIDYAICASDSYIYSSAPVVVGNLTLPYIDDDYHKDRHWTHYSIWRTCDTGTNGVDPTDGEGNNTELYGWVADVPIIKSFYANATNDGYVYIVSGNVSEYDIGSDLYLNMAGVVYSFRITDADEGSNIYTVNQSTGGFYPNASDTMAFIGSYTGCIFSASGGVITKLVGRDFTDSDVGTTLTLTDGNTLYLSGVSGGVGYTLETDTITLDVASWGPHLRSFNDTLTDDELRGRFNAYPLQQRFYENVPNSDIGNITNGMMFCANRDANYIYYSQIPEGYEYLAGYYHPLYQLINVKDSIKAFGEFSDRLAIYCNNSVTTIPTNVFTSVTLEDLGVDITVVSGKNLADATIGVIDYGSIASVGIDMQVMITNEPAIRVFDGYSFSDNIASHRIMNVLRSLRTNSSAMFVPNTGYVFWGSDEQ